MKLKFKNQAFQTDAVNAVVDLFRGQDKRRDTFTITNELQLDIDGGLGVRNALTLTDEHLADNMREVQKRHSLPLTDDLAGNHFCVEMETGTGKTYVYTKTIFELNKQYGFTKFIVVVPSVAIREGVYKSFQITAEHFAEQYDNAPCRCFIYDSKKLSAVRVFATSSDIEIMIINIDAFKKSENVINQEHDKLSGAAAINLIQATSPIVIIDEPQSVDNTPKAKEAIATLNPLCVFRYSATHKEKINLLFRLTPVDAYQMGLVKQICVSSNQVESDFNRPYIRLVSVNMDNGFSAKVEIDKTQKSGVTRKVVTVKPGADLYTLSGERELYKGYGIAGIDCTPGFEGIEFSDSTILALSKAMGDIDEALIKRAQIRRTIEAHLEKELRYTEKGIKVLSLFFIDEVGKYRTIEGEKGVYAVMFEDCYAELMALPKFAALRERFKADVSVVHNGYFSQDKKGVYKNTKGDTVDDYDTYNTIMKDKEWLLSFDCPLRFIFSHSALKEGWDNPNVFQVCTLIEQKSAFTARQKVGRGLRLCVNQEGERIEDRNINILHVMANESFAEFAENLQKEIEAETGVKFGVLQLSLFSGLTFTAPVTEEKKVTEHEAKAIADYVTALVTSKTEQTETAEAVPVPAPPVEIISPALAPVIEKVVAAAQMGAEVTAEKVAAITYTETAQVEQIVSYNDAAELLTHFEKKGYVTKSGTIKDTMKAALAAGTLDLPAKFEAAREKFESVISKANTRPIVHDASKEVRVKLKKQVLISPEFLALWEKIKGRTAYRVQIDEPLLVARCIEQLRLMESVPKARIVTQTANIDVQNAGVSGFETSVRTTDLADEGHKLPEFLRVVDNECFLLQTTVADILTQSGRVADYLNNPQRMAEMFIETVKAVQNGMEIDGICYHRLSGEEYYLQEIFDSEELIAYLDKNAVNVQHSVYDYVIYDSDTVERPFAVALDDDSDVRMFFKIPQKFKIETPIGTYNPDWAVYLDKDGVEKLYFVLETKGTTTLEGLRGEEKQKIHCGERHFAALDEDVVFSGKPVRDWREFKVKV
ncbi:MAG: DEAD/DEAH box helicase family protein [Oscillospiraceae bacterium]|jgi:type III restriction enzyme|nr:DEAD/DEAH box helicase family protein [Oscillospiraceae bacterium]